jgi:Acetyltransferase (GNAT) family
MISIRPAVENDNEAICSVDLIAQRENKRREFIRRVVTSGECLVADGGEKVIGYGGFNYSFYDSGFIEMLYIGSDYRRSGAALVKYLESLCQTPKFFTNFLISKFLALSII